MLARLWLMEENLGPQRRVNGERDVKNVRSPSFLLFVSVVAASGLLAGCAGNQRVRLAGPDQSGRLNPVTVVDRREQAAKRFHSEGRPHCFRSYGDGFIDPSTFEYLRTFIVTKTSAHPPTLIEITRLETVEYCDGAVKRTRGIGLGAVTAGVTGGKVILPESTPNDVSGDRFVLHIAGTVDRKLFEITKQFGYDDLKYLNYPKEDPEYLARIRSTFAAAADDIVSKTTTRQ
jgi:hypothetical protein